METKITIELPFKRIPAPNKNKFYAMLPRRVRWWGWLYSWAVCSIQEFGGSRVNTRRHLQLFRRHILTVSRNEYHDRSDAERADEYLTKWSECEKELRGLRLIMLGDELGADVKKLIKESLGINLDEGTIR